MSVFAAETLSHKVDNSLGNPQGSVLGPLMFPFYVTFIASNIHKFVLSVSYARNYLNDIEEDMRKLQQHLNHVAKSEVDTCKIYFPGS